MASPEVNGATLQASGSTDCVVKDLFGTLRGWKKKFWSKEGGVPNRKDVSYIAPNGEEIKSARHLICYLKVYAGDLKAGDFCWTSVEAPRRSARLNRKLGRHILFEELETLPAKRMRRNKNSHGKDALQSGRGTVAKEELFVDRCQISGTSDAPSHTVGSNHGENGVAEIEVSKPLENSHVSLLNNQTLAVDIARVPQLETLWDDKDVEVDIAQEAMTLDVQIPLEVVFNKPPLESSDPPVEGMLLSNIVTGFDNIQGELANLKASVAVEDIEDMALIEATVASITATLVQDPYPDEEIDAELSINDVTNLVVTTPIMQETEDLCGVKESDLPLPQGIHALLNETVLVNGNTKPESQASLELLDRLLEPIDVMQ
ncbi:uncharacterized protein [Physcomitrium patens]|uniref:MBD domain-containing protein n=1 Tax=Physcomitrium patens TaxID=3218 RepID=A0A2K1IBF0_PHYPA|nr:methyl-CpG-binding domain-containing protein 11-like [Physcomitrium patens]PNR26598.1 hypothetical protein PHYPA_030079 [Physcomitrium patens]|eukprot:XP_024366921.1 methyl-CpG-binding domain-containing protein 11-like [Physcomitrella patens]